VRGRPRRRRLAEINPDELADKVTDAVAVHVRRVAEESGWKLDVPADPRGSKLHQHVKLLAECAIGTASVEEDGSISRVDARFALSLCVATVATAVWGRPVLSRGHLPRKNVEDLSNDWIGELHLVLMAAPARVDLGMGKDISAADLSLLYGCSPAHVRLCCRNGTLPAKRVEGGWIIKAEDAMQWMKRGET